MNEQEIREIIRDEINKYFRQMIGKMFGSLFEKELPLLPTSKAYKKLGFLSEKALRDAVSKELFRLGEEVYDRRPPNSQIPLYVFDIEACKKRLKNDPARRVA